MSFDAVDLDVFTAHLNRPGAAPAPTAAGDDPPILTGPWQPRRPTVDELCASARQTVVDLHAAIARSRQARGADTDLREVA
ncbi:hypothetical protein [Micromonospora sp. NPDC005299]|uniref:hypothetical protein n=1 Tax=Micromonospora sp. NPDC005299 TaxID=3364231 RepID=UPI003689E467